jgi:hypothetical protein
MDVWTFGLGEAIRFEAGRAGLRVFRSSRFKGQRVDRIVQGGGVRADDAEIVTDLHSLVGTQIQIQFHASAENAVEILAEYNSSAKLAAGGGESVEVSGDMEGDRRFFHEGQCDVAGVNRVTTEFDLGDGAMAARIDDANAADLAVRASGGGEQFSLARINLVFVDIARGKRARRAGTLSTSAFPCRRLRSWRRECDPW